MDSPQVPAADEHRARVQMERHAALQHDGSGEISARGKEDRASARARAGIDGLLDRPGVEMRAVAGGAMVPDIEAGLAGGGGRDRGGGDSPSRKRRRSNSFGIADSLLR